SLDHLAQIAVARQGIGDSVASVQLDSAIKQPKRLFVVFLLPGGIQRNCTEKEVIGIDALGRLPPGALYLGVAQLRLDGTHDGGRDQVLQVENVAHRAVEMIGPDMRAGRRVDELACDPYSVACPPHTALEQVADPELATDTLHLDRLALVREA